MKVGAAVDDLLALAPFLSEETLDKCAVEVFEREGIQPLLKLAPFMSEEGLDELAKQAYASGGKHALVALAPFVSEEGLEECAKLAFAKEGPGALPRWLRSSKKSYWMSWQRQSLSGKARERCSPWLRSSVKRL